MVKDMFVLDDLILTAIEHVKGLYTKLVGISFSGIFYENTANTRKKILKKMSGNLCSSEKCC